MQQKKEKKLKTAQLIALLCKYPCASDVVVPTLDGELSQYLKLEEHNGQIWLMATTPENSDNIIFFEAIRKRAIADLDAAHKRAENEQH